MRIAVLSDLHIGRDPRTDAFGHEPDRFTRWLDDLAARHDTVVLLGDVYQTDHGAWPGARARARALHAIRRRVPALTERFDHPPFVYVHGNHDEIAASELGASARVMLADGAICCVHGHGYDPVARTSQSLADLGTWSMGRLRALGARPLARAFEGHDVAIKHRRFGGATGAYAEGARELARETSARVVVMGHTHVPEVHRIGDDLFVDDGTCSEGRLQWAEIDTDAGTVELRAGARGVTTHRARWSVGPDPGTARSRTPFA